MAHYLNGYRLAFSAFLSAAVSLGLMFIFSVPSSRAEGNLAAASQIDGYAKLVFRNYEDSLHRARHLEESIRILLSSPSVVSLQKARTAWLNARVAYGQSEAFRFYGGPIDYYDSARDVEGPEGRLNSWPVNEAYIDYVQGNSSAGIINDESVELTKVSIVSRNQIEDDRDVSTGYHAIEFLLWGQDLSEAGPGARPASDYTPGTSTNDRRRKYLQLVTAQLVEDHEFLVAQWQPGMDNYAAEFQEIPEGTALGYILTGLLTMSQFELASERIAVPLDSGDPEDEHSCFSDNTHNDFLYNVLGIENVYFGRYENYFVSGIGDLVEKIDPQLNQRMFEALAETKSAVKRVRAPFDRVLLSPAGSLERTNAELVVDALMRQAALIKEIGARLGLTVNVNDGEAG